MGSREERHNTDVGKSQRVGVAGCEMAGCGNGFNFYRVSSFAAAVEDAGSAVWVTSPFWAEGGLDDPAEEAFGGLEEEALPASR